MSGWEYLKTANDSLLKKWLEEDGVRVVGWCLLGAIAAFLTVWFSGTLAGMVFMFACVVVGRALGDYYCLLHTYREIRRRRRT